MESSFLFLFFVSTTTAERPNGWHEGLGKACYSLGNYKKDDF